MAEKNPYQKWSISYLWEHFLVPGHRIPIWLIFKLGFSAEGTIDNMEMLIVQYSYAKKTILFRLRVRVTRLINQRDHPRVA